MLFIVALFQNFILVFWKEIAMALGSVVGLFYNICFAKTLRSILLSLVIWILLSNQVFL
jgi:hypothetical protein